MAESLCNTCFNGFSRKWERDDKPESEFSSIWCTIYPNENVTHLIMIKCSKYDERKMTRREFEADQANMIRKKIEELEIKIKGDEENG